MQKEPDQMVHYTKSYSYLNLILLNVTAMIKKTCSFLPITLLSYGTLLESPLYLQFSE